MLMSKKKTTDRAIAVPINDTPVGVLMDKEWLLTNSRGGFAAGTVAACNTRRYHGLLTGSLPPPANRTMALSNYHETVFIGGCEVRLGNFEFKDSLAADGLRYSVAFRKDIGVHHDFDLGLAEITRSVYLLPDSDAVGVVYEFSHIREEFDFAVRPLVGMRDFHAMQKSTADIRTTASSDEVRISGGNGHNAELVVRSDDMSFHLDGQWWYNFLYRKERQRGQDCLEDLWVPGTFTCHVDTPGRVILWASLGPKRDDDDVDEIADLDLETVIDSLSLREKELTANADPGDATETALHSAAGQFLVHRQIARQDAETILAGFPWFLDWGRDTFIALPGLLLCTGRFDQAAGVLTTFAQAVDKGMIPNRFDDYGNEPHYNSIDASLWFVHASFEYLRETSDVHTFSMELLPAIRWITDSYYKGTRFGIHADTDGLITGGDKQTQLTWMDAKCGGTAFTPRHGKPVEVNALWYNALASLRDYYVDKDGSLAGHYASLARQAKESFAKTFWNEDAGHLNDCIAPNGQPDSSLRPNQIYAVSLPHSPLDHDLQLRVVDAVQTNLLTPYGLRTLSPNHSSYIGTYEGDQMHRDAAYHQGTVWPHLIGPFIEAYLRVNNFSKQSKRKTTRFLRPLLAHLTEDACLGSISEIFDGDRPHNPKGCFAQAWSVAAVLRAYHLINT